jgi:hypothetical protein
MLRIFHEYNYESSILDDFEFYEIKQHKIEKKKDKIGNPIESRDKETHVLNYNSGEGRYNNQEINRICKGSVVNDVSKEFCNINITEIGTFNGNTSICYL